jgi:hypothetical protein
MRRPLVDQVWLVLATVLVFAVWTQFCWLPGRSEPGYLRTRGIVLLVGLALLLAVAGWHRWRRK